MAREKTEFRDPKSRGKIRIGPFHVAIIIAVIATLWGVGTVLHSYYVKQPDRAEADVLISQSETIQHAVDHQLRRGASPATLVVSESLVTRYTRNAIFGQGDGAVAPLEPPRGSVPAGARWTFARGVAVPGLHKPDGAFVTAIRVTAGACGLINAAIFGQGVINAPPSFGRHAVVMLEVPLPGPSVTPATNQFVFSSQHDTILDGLRAACGTDGREFYFYRFLTWR